MDARFWIENSTDHDVDVYLEQVTVTVYFARIRRNQRIACNPDEVLLIDRDNDYTLRATDATASNYDAARVFVARISQGAYRQGRRIGTATKYVVCLAEDNYLTWINVPFSPASMDTIFANGQIMASTGYPAISCNEALTCDYFKRCKRYFKNLVKTVGSSILDSQYDKCFCESCATRRGDRTSNVMGDPPRRFTVPIGYAKFGVKINSQAESEDIFKKWHVCYHGTATDNVSDILKAGRLLKPGDRTPSGLRRVPGPGRFTEETSPMGHNVKQYFFSPSPAYCEYGNLYAVTSDYTDPNTGQRYKARAVLQIRLKPGSYKERSQTMGATRIIDPNFSNDKLEWMTDYECVHHIYGVLIKLKAENPIYTSNPSTPECNIL